MDLGLRGPAREKGLNPEGQDLDKGLRPEGPLYGNVLDVERLQCSSTLNCTGLVESEEKPAEIVP